MSLHLWEHPPGTFTAPRLLTGNTPHDGTPVPKKTTSIKPKGADPAPGTGDLSPDIQGPPFIFPERVDYFTGNPDHNILGNDYVGDCVAACMGHMVNQWTWQSAMPQPVTYDMALRFYAEITGWNGVDHSTGTDTGSLLSDAQTAMVAGGLGGQQALSWVPLSVESILQLKFVTWNFLGVPCGLQLPQSAYDQFNAGEPWDALPGGSPLVGGHCVYMCGYDTEYYYCNTWGVIIKVTQKFVDTYFDEAYCITSPLMRTSVGLGTPHDDVLNYNWTFDTGSPAQPFTRLPYRMID